MCGPIWSVRRGASKAFLTAQHFAWIASQHPDRSLSPTPGSISLTHLLKLSELNGGVGVGKQGFDRVRSADKGSVDLPMPRARPCSMYRERIAITRTQ